MPLGEFNARCDARIASENAASRAAGEPYPDQDWVEIALMVWPELHELDVQDMVELCRRHAACCRRCTATAGAVEALESLKRDGILLGIASNAQTYTVGELRDAGIRFSDFDDNLIFLSGVQGFAKPSPRVFAFLTERLAQYGIAPHETLMIGDSLENDILPASAAGWRTWHIGPQTWRNLTAAWTRMDSDTPAKD